jgi:hypothetical protein
VTGWFARSEAGGGFSRTNCPGCTTDRPLGPQPAGGFCCSAVPLSPPRRPAPHVCWTLGFLAPLQRIARACPNRLTCAVPWDRASSDEREAPRRGAVERHGNARRACRPPRRSRKRNRPLRGFASEREATLRDSRQRPQLVTLAKRQIDSMGDRERVCEARLLVLHDFAIIWRERRRRAAANRLGAINVCPGRSAARHRSSRPASQARW